MYRYENEFEKDLINHITTIGQVKQWQYVPEIKTTNALWNNFKHILEQNNQGRLDNPLSITEFAQVKRVIEQLDTPYKAGQFLYGVNGVSEIEIDLDTGKHVFLTVFDQSQVGAGFTVYQIVNQIEREAVLDGYQDRRFDVTLLINGLPIIQIELKADGHTINESMNQLEQYIAERQFSNIYSTVQILVAMTPYDVRYFANTKLEDFNRAFAFCWQNEKSQPVRDWRTFTNIVLSIPMAHDLATRFMVLDGTKNKESIKVMRPYQVYATKKVIEKVKKFDFESRDGKLGYVWHTTGSGKTITSFKTAWLASRLPNVDKVVFLVDRIALTNQTADAYNAYDPISSLDKKSGVVGETANIIDLHNLLSKKSDKNIIVTSIQKMNRYVSKESFKLASNKILFIVDEAHRSTGDGSSEGMLETIRKKFPFAGWIGYTGTPRFDVVKNVFGDLVHAYTIKDAIADRNVLGFNVEFKETITTPEDHDEDDFDELRETAYDTSPKHVELVVEEIVKNWKNRSNNRKYNALLTVHVGGNKSSIARAMEYFEKFEEKNKELKPEDRLSVGISFSMDTSNGAHMLNTNKSLNKAIQHYNRMFDTTFDMTTVRAYTEDLIRRLNKTADDGKFLDLVVVVDQLLTGFDAPQLNTLYVDRSLRGSSLIQAYSRTNRVHKRDTKPWGNIINYRWPKQNEEEMNKALYIYSNPNSAMSQEKMNFEVIKTLNKENGLTSESFEVTKDKVINILDKLSELTSGFNEVPKSENVQQEVYEALKEYNLLINELKQYSAIGDKRISAYDEDKSAFYELLGITEDDEVRLTTVIANELKEILAKREDVDISQIDLAMSHIHDVRINYDYLVDLIAKMADYIHEKDNEKALETYNEIKLEIAKSDNERERKRILNITTRILEGVQEFSQYPAPTDVDTMYQELDRLDQEHLTNQVTNFIVHWGLVSVSPNNLMSFLKKHKVGKDDLDNQGELTAMMKEAKEKYPLFANDDIKKMSWLQYRNKFREAIRIFADEIKKGE